MGQGKNVDQSSGSWTFRNGSRLVVSGVPEIHYSRRFTFTESDDLASVTPEQYEALAHAFAAEIERREAQVWADMLRDDEERRRFGTAAVDGTVIGDDYHLSGPAEG